ncbi:MAG: shikimate kinase [Clostridiales bacterium]|jgi:shikimate kinase|nr:shikimate kinase [Clostridiales bacterium]
MKYKINQNIVLIGFMGAGKTCIGRRLARRLKLPFEDTDSFIEKKEQCSIRQIFETHGEEYFRDLETELLLELKKSNQLRILSTGGGLPMREQNRLLLREIGHVVYLQAYKDTIIQRLAGDTSRPLLQGEELAIKVDKLLAIRAPFYEATAHTIISTDGKTIDEVTQIIIDRMISGEEVENENLSSERTQSEFPWN